MDRYWAGRLPAGCGQLALTLPGLVWLGASISEQSLSALEAMLMFAVTVSGILALRLGIKWMHGG